MAEVVRFPKVAPGVEEAMVGVWRKSEGEHVSVGEPLVEMITDKATFDLESDAEGVLLRIVAPPKSSVPVQYILGIVGEAGETAPDVAEENARLVEAHLAKATSAKWAAPGPGRAAAGHAARATPGARRAARKAGVSLEDVAKGLGKGVVKEDDVRRFLEGRDGSGG